MNGQRKIFKHSLISNKKPETFHLSEKLPLQFGLLPTKMIH